MEIISEKKGAEVDFKVLSVNKVEREGKSSVMKVEVELASKQNKKRITNVGDAKRVMKEGTPLTGNNFYCPLQITFLNYVCALLFQTPTF